MRACLAIIHDSFRAALASRVLYVVLGLILLILLALAPFHVRQQVDWKLNPGMHFPGPDRLAQRLIEEGKSGERSAVAHVWNLLSPSIQQSIEEHVRDVEEGDTGDPVDPSGMAPVFSRLANELNELIARRDFYSEEAFRGKRAGPEAQALLDRGVESLSELELKRLNRLLLAVALRRDIAMPGNVQLDFYYAVWHWRFLTTSVSHGEFASGVVSFLPDLFDNWIMSIGIFIAILVTAFIIPEMLEAGSLNLLLSKPIHRPVLLLAKFAGGCLFVLICASLFFGGIWLWMGIQLGIWERALLLSIPVYVVVFAMYYSVSVLAGLLFRSVILCIVFAVLFWGVCFAVGTGYRTFDSRFYNAAPAEIVPAGSELVMVDGLQQNYRWDPSGKQWRPLAEREFSEQDAGIEIASWIERLNEIPDLPGPVWMADEGVLFASDCSPMKAISSQASGSIDFVAVTAASAMSARAAGTLPNGTVAIFAGSGGSLLAVDRSAFVWKKPVAELIAQEDPNGTGETDNGDGESGAGGLRELFSRTTTGTGGFSRVGNYEPLNVNRGRSVSYHAASGEIAVWSQGQIAVLVPDGEGNYSSDRQREIGQQVNLRMAGWIAHGGESLFLLLGNGQFVHLDGKTLDEIHTEKFDSVNVVRTLDASADGRFVAVTFRNGQLWLYDSQANAEADGYGFGLQGDVLAAGFDGEGFLWTGDRFQGVRKHDLTTMQTVESHLPAGDTLTSLFRWIIRPLYRAFPKPGEFDKVITWLSSSKDTETTPAVDLTVVPAPDDPWRPLTSGLAFMFVMLGISCIVFQRADY